MRVARAALVPGLVVLAVVAGLWLYGLGTGGSFYFKNAQAPLAAAASAPYHRESLLHVGLAHLLGVTTSILGFRVFVLVFWWAAVATVTTAARRSLSTSHVLLVWLAALTHPAAMIVHTWTCHPDAPLLLLSAGLLWFARRPWMALLLAAMAAWTNLPMALVLGLSTALLWIGFDEERARTRSIAMLLGLAVGAASCRLTLFLSGVHLGRDRFAAALAHDPATLSNYWTAPGWPIAYSLYFAHLMWLPSLIATLPRAGRLAFVATQLLALVAAGLAEDTTRVFACLAWGPLLVALVHALRSLELPGAHDRFHLRPLVAIAAVVSVLAPKFFAWKGQLHTIDGARANLHALLF